MRMQQVRLLGLWAVFTALSAAAWGSELQVATATTDITPKLPVAVTGQFNLRIATQAETPLTANVLVLQSQTDGKPGDCAVIVSCDIVAVSPEILEAVRQAVHKRVPDLDTQKIFMAGTHTHTAPVIEPGVYPIPETGVTQVAEYHAFLAERVSEAIERAWNARKPGSVTWGLGHAVVAYNRRASYADGRSQMYGPTDVPDFRGLEGYEDHDINSLFVWNSKGKLIGIAVNVSCTSQEVEGRSTVNADFWHPVRKRLHARYGDEVCVLGLTGAAGDQSPHLMYRKAADDRMTTLRGLDRMDEIARRIDRAVDEAFEAVKNDRHADAVLAHGVEKLQLPGRLVLEPEYKEAKAACEEAAAQMAKDPKSAEQVMRRMKWYEVTVQRFEKQATNPHPTFDAEIHAVRIGDAAVCTNPFELFTDYGIRIKARSPAVQTFVVQLVGEGTYLPTEKAVRGGHYSAIVHSGMVGPEGGQVLVDRTVELLKSLWK
jgi:hypothetical protein